MYWYYDFIVDYDGFSYDSNDFDFDNDSLSNYDLSEIEKDAVHNMCIALCKKFNLKIVEDGSYECTFKSSKELDIDKVKDFIDNSLIGGEGTIEVYPYESRVSATDNYDSYEVKVSAFVDGDYVFEVSADQDELREYDGLNEQIVNSASKKHRFSLLEALNKLNSIKN